MDVNQLEQLRPVVRSFLTEEAKKIGAESNEKWIDRVTDMTLSKPSRMQNRAWIEKQLFNLKQSQEAMERKKSIGQTIEKSKHYGYFPFVKLRPNEVRYIQHECGEWVLELMLKKFQDPAKAHGAWTLRAAKAMKELGEAKCVMQEKLHEFIVSSEEFKSQAKMSPDELVKYESADIPIKPLVLKFT